MTERAPAWERFRRLPLWGQAVVWVVLWPVPIALLAASKPSSSRRRWWAVTAALAIVWVGAAASGARPQAADERQSATPGPSDVVVPPGSEEPPTSTSSGPPRTTSTTSPAVSGPDATSAAPSTTTPPTSRPTTTTSSTTTTTTTVPAPSEPLPGPSSFGEQLLAQLRVAPEGPRAGYHRDLFPHWIDVDGDRCDTREEVLIAESRSAAQVDHYGCKVVAGDWYSLYDGIGTDQPADLDIDQVVALAEAWDSGASTWDPDRRRDFANDLGYEGSLIAVTASSNRSKGDSDPAEWRPPKRGAWCQFATSWVSVKIRWELSADEAEVAALRTAFEACDGSTSGYGSPGPVASPTTTTAPSPSPPGPPAAASALTVSALDCLGERVTVTNAGPADVDLTRWTLHDEEANHTFFFPAGYHLAPGASVTVVSANGAVGPGDLYWSGWAVWNNDGDTATLVDPVGAPRSTRTC